MIEGCISREAWVGPSMEILEEIKQRGAENDHELIQFKKELEFPVSRPPPQVPAPVGGGTRATALERWAKTSERVEIEESERMGFQLERMITGLIGPSLVTKRSKQYFPVV